MIEFWGEWEPPSEVESVEVAIEDGPRYVHRPFWSEPLSYAGLQNTDPFVFREGFGYAICQQRTSRGRTCLNSLAEGSVILFGSQRRRREFTLDTVFVVRRSILYSAATLRETVESEVDQGYFNATFLPWFAGQPDPAAELRLYLGATIDKPVDDMFSFFPCRRASEIGSGFARPAIRLEGYVNPKLAQGKRAPAVTSEEASALWRSVRQQVEDHGLLLGLRSDMPVAR